MSFAISLAALMGLSISLAFLFLSAQHSEQPAQSPFRISFPPQPALPNRPMVRVAVIGAGAAGTSASFFISHLANISTHCVSIDIFESSDYVGGRSTVIHPFDSHLFDPIEAGASIFVNANKNLHKAVKAFKLQLKTFDEDDGGNMGIWDGTEFAFKETGQHWLDAAKMFWRYGRAPYQLNSVKDETVTRFKSVYEQPFTARGPYANLTAWAEASGLSELLLLTGTQQLIDQHGINVQAVNELAAAACRVNYGQDVSDLHALATLVSLAGSNGVSVVGGNRQIFERFASESQATVHLGHRVTKISKVKQVKPNSTRNQQYSITYRNSSQAASATDSEPYDAVIIAAPFQQSEISLANLEPSLSIPIQPYVHLHVTFVITNATSPSGQLFGLTDQDCMPRTIYSTMMRNVLGKGQRPIFNSLSYLRNLGSKVGVIGDLHVVKLFSEASLPTEALAQIFNSSSNLIWLKRLEWDAYPVLSPVDDPIRFAPIQLDNGLYYANGFERLLSTMETETVAAWNIANLISDHFWNFRASKSWADE